MASCKEERGFLEGSNLTGDDKSDIAGGSDRSGKSAGEPMSTERALGSWSGFTGSKPGLLSMPLKLVSVSMVPSGRMTALKDINRHFAKNMSYSRGSRKTPRWPKIKAHATRSIKL